MSSKKFGTNVTKTLNPPCSTQHDSTHPGDVPKPFGGSHVILCKVPKITPFLTKCLKLYSRE